MEKLYDNVQVLRLTNWKNKVTVEIEIASIIYLETNNRHTHIVTTNYDFNAYESFKTIKNRIENEVTYFAQPHQSFFVNMRYVTYYNHFRVVLTYGDKNYDVDMSRRQYSVFDAKFFMQAKELK